jgi:hypothetical protein
MTHSVTKLGIGMPSAGECRVETALSLMTASWYAGVPLQCFTHIGCYIHIGRESIAKQSLEHECSHLLFVDSDIICHHDAIARLIAHDVDIVGARYNKKVSPAEAIVKDEIMTLAPVKFVPTGFLLINTDVFKKMGAPYFSFDNGAESEDVFFCDKAIASGYDVHCDPTIQIGHVGTMIF